MNTNKAAQAGEGRRGSALHRMITSPIFIVTALFVLILVVGSITVPSMLKRSNLTNVARNGAITGMFAIAATIVLLVGEIDLSLGTTMMLSLVVGAQLYQVTSDVVMILATLATGLLLGLINGLIVTRFKVKSLMATLGTQSLFGSLAYLISRGRTMLFYQAPNYIWMGQGYILGIPVPVVFFVITVLILFIVLQYSRFGREAYFTGTNPLAAWLAGVNTSRIKLIAFVISGFCAAAGGLFQAALINEVYISTGAGYELTGLAIAIFGGASLKGGKGSVLSTAVAVMAFQLLLNVMTLSGMGTYMEQVFKGIFLIIIVVVFQYLERRRYAKL